MTHNAKHMKNQLFGREVYLKDLINAQSWIVKSSIHSKISLSKKGTTLSINTTNHFDLMQTQIVVPALHKNNQAA